jgi:hypothetical protein
VLSYRRIDHEKHYAAEIWNIECAGPKWFREANAVWTAKFSDFEAFYNRCEVWGLFDADVPARGLLAVVYLEFANPTAVNIHVSVLSKLPIDEVVRFFVSLTRHKTEAEGVRSKEAWILKGNRFLLDIARRSNYHPSGLVMDYGAARGKVLRWVQVTHQ